MEFRAILQNRNKTSWSDFILIPDQISGIHVGKFGKRCLCTLNGKLKIQVALLGNGNGSFFIGINKTVQKKLNLEVGNEIEVRIEEDQSKYGIELPPEMEELLAQDKIGSHWFHSLTIGKQRSLLYIIGKPKSSEIRIRKGIMVLDYLTTTEGRLDFEELNLALKQSY